MITSLPTTITQDREQQQFITETIIFGKTTRATSSIYDYRIMFFVCLYLWLQVVHTGKINN